MNREDLERLNKVELVELVLKLQHPTKTSRTSSKPPSTDRKAKRENSKPGGAKPGHEGHSRRLATDPDEIVDHRPERCTECGDALGDATGEIIGEYDEIDIPPILPVVKRHRRISCVCGSCGAKTKAPVPKAASGSPFGPVIGALTFYCKHLQHFSYQRLQALFKDVFGLKISEGGIGNLLQREGQCFLAQKADCVQRLRQAPVVASDETGMRIEGANAQHWVFRAANVVVHQVAFSRGAQVVRDMMDGHQPAYWISDRYSAQQGHAERHQTCLAHLARDAAWVLEHGDVNIGLSLKIWFKDAFDLARSMQTLASSTIARKAKKLDNRIGTIIARSTSCAGTAKVQRKIANARDQLLTFTRAPPGMVDATNNGCERDLRPCVTSRKVTNGFRSLWGAEVDAALRTVVSTERMAGTSSYDAIRATITA